MKSAGEVFGMVILVVLLVPTVIWAVVWTLVAIAGSVDAAKKVKDHLESEGTPKPLAWPLAIIIGLAFFAGLCWLIGQSANY